MPRSTSRLFLIVALSIPMLAAKGPTCCHGPEDCEGLPHRDCPGSWQCVDNPKFLQGPLCVWGCDAVDGFCATASDCIVQKLEEPMCLAGEWECKDQLCLYRCDSPVTDRDEDGIDDDVDECPDDPFNDVDGDGLCANDDNCPYEANADQDDSDGDGKGDECDIEDHWYDLTVVSDTDDQIVIDFDLLSYILAKKTVGSKTYTQIITGSHDVFQDAPGRPEIPSVRFLVELPVSRNSVEAQYEADYSAKDCNPLLPYVMSDSEIEDIQDKDFYSNLPALYPSQGVVRVLSVSNWGWKRVAEIEVTPFVYVPNRGVLKITKRARISLNLSNRSTPLGNPIGSPYSMDLHRAMLGKILNIHDHPEIFPDRELVVVVTSSNYAEVVRSHWAVQKSSNFDVDILNVEDILKAECPDCEDLSKLEPYQLKHYLWSNYFDASPQRPFAHLMIVGNEDIVPLGHPESWGLFASDKSRFTGIEISGQILLPAKGLVSRSYYKILCGDACELRIGCLDDPDNCSKATVPTPGEDDEEKLPLIPEDSQLTFAAAADTTALESLTSTTWKDFRLRLVNLNYGTTLSIKKVNALTAFDPSLPNLAPGEHITRSQIGVKTENGGFKLGAYHVRLVSLPKDKFSYRESDFSDASPIWEPRGDDTLIEADWNSADGYSYKKQPDAEFPPFGFAQQSDEMHPFNWGHLLKLGDVYYAMNDGNGGKPAFSVGRIPIQANRAVDLGDILDLTILRQKTSEMSPEKERRLLSIVGTPSFSKRAIDAQFWLSRLNATETNSLYKSIGIFDQYVQFEEPTKDFYGQYGTRIRSLIADGIGLLIWDGHGDPESMSEILKTSNLSEIPPDSVSHVASISCLTGALGDWNADTAAGKMVLTGIAGTVFASTDTIDQIPYSSNTVRDLFVRQRNDSGIFRWPTIGGIWFHMTNMFNFKPDFLTTDGRSWILFGDPTAPLVQGRDADLDGTENFSGALFSQTCDLHTPQDAFLDEATNWGASHHIAPKAADVCLDNCPFTSNNPWVQASDTVDTYSDAVGDTCDNCPDILNAWQDIDAEGKPVCEYEPQPLAVAFLNPLTCNGTSVRTLCTELNELPPFPTNQNVRIRYVASGTLGTKIGVRVVDASVATSPLPTQYSSSAECTINQPYTLCVHNLRVPSGQSYRILVDVISPSTGEIALSGFKVIPEKYPIQFTSRQALTGSAYVEEWTGTTEFLNTKGASPESEMRGFVGVVSHKPSGKDADTVAKEIENNTSIWCPNGDTSLGGVILPRLGFGDDMTHTLTFDLYTITPPWHDPGYNIGTEFSDGMLDVFLEAGLIRIVDSVSGTRALIDYPFRLSGDNPRKVEIQLKASDLTGIHDATVEFCIRGYGSYAIDNISIRDHW